MNANELAVELERYLKGEEYDRLVWEIPDFLRQQQAEIEALKQIIDANNLSQNIGQFVKPANEPVAWAVWEGRPHDLFFTKEESDELCRLKGGDAKTVPLYTHPAKTLTDEEIKQIFQEQTGFYFDDNPADDLALMDFARAILRKAQE